MMTRSEKINLAATIAGPALLGLLGMWGLWSINARLTMERSASDKFNAETYVSKAWFQESNAESNKKLDRLTEGFNSVQTDVATIKGELSGGVVKTKNQ